MAKKVTIIEPVREDIRKVRKTKLQVCAYVRVSTGSDAQANSFITMITYYTELIESNPDVVLQIIYGSMLHFIYNHFQDYPECHITLFKPNSAH